MYQQFFSYHPLNGGALAISHRLPMCNGRMIPQLGFGTYRMLPNETEGAVSYAIECGFRHIDCAKAYFNQKEVGLALQTCMKAGHIKREDIFITSKLWPTDQHPCEVALACRETLQQLQLDYLDLYLIHWPVCWKHPVKFETDEDKYPKDADGLAAVDDTVKLADTWKAMSSLVDEGLVHSIGLSNCTVAQVKEVAELDSLNSPVLNQVELHPAHVDRHLLHCHRQHNLLTAAYCPLGMPTRYTPPGFKPLVENETIKALATRCGFSPQRLLLNWNLDNNNVVIVKASKKEHIKSNSKAARFVLDDPARMLLNGFQDVVDRFRVVNPTNFTKSSEPFFNP